MMRPKEAVAQGIADDASDDDIIARMAEHPTLLQRPIAIDGDRAILARPADELRGFLGV